MNLDCTPDHSVRQPIKFHLRALRVLRGERLRFIPGCVQDRAGINPGLQRFWKQLNTFGNIFSRNHLRTSCKKRLQPLGIYHPSLNLAHDSIICQVNLPCQSLNPSILQSFNPSILQSLNSSIPRSLNPSIPQSLNP